MMARLSALAAAASLCASLAGCQFGSTTGGSETTNGLTGRIQDADGKPVPGARMTLVPADYNPVPGKDARALARTETDKQGRYRFAAVAPGEYDLESRDSARGLRALLPGLRIAADQTAALTADGTVKVTGVLRIPFADRHLPENTVLYVPGTTQAVSIVGKLDDQGYLTLPGLAEGDYKVLMAHFPDPADGTPIAVAEEFGIKAGDTTRLAAFADWAHARVLRFDLGADGDAVAAAAAARGAADKAAYPLLVRLRAPDFDFSQARSGGEDFRFEKPDGSLAHYQIERWDAVAGEADVWVRIDAPRSGPDSLILHWGRKDAREMSEPARVFDAALGLRSAWHLGDAASPYRDATATASHAATVDPDTGAAYAAVVGKGKAFRAAEGGQLSAALPAGYQGNGAWSVTFWMRFRPATARTGVVTFGEATTQRGIHFLVRPDTTFQIGPWDYSADATPSAQQNHFSMAGHVDKWVHVATAYDPVAQNLRTWIDGVEADVSPVSPLDINPAGGIHFGRGISPRDGAKEINLDGGLDEVRFYDRPLSAAEAKLDFSTQRRDAAIAGFR